MIELKINNRPVVLEKDFKFKLTIENTYFTKAGSYTRDIKIPMSSMRNRVTFANISRADIAKKNIEYDVELNIDNLTTLRGKALLRNVTDTHVTIQCLFDNSAFNLMNKIGEKYINTLVPDFQPYPKKNNFDNLTDEELYQRVGSWPDRKFIWMPVYNIDADKVYNGYEIRINKPGLRMNVFEKRLACQPYLAHVFQSIVGALLYNLDDESRHFDFDQLYLVNATADVGVNYMLPRWRVNEFFTQIENFFGFILVVENNTVKIVSSDDFYKNIANTTNLKVISKYSTEIEQEVDDQDLSLANIKYDLISSNVEEHREIDLSQFRGQIKTYITYDKMIIGIANIHKDKDDSVENWLYKADDRYYIADIFDKSYKLTEVNRYAPLIRDDDNENFLELKIVPVAMGMFDVEAFGNATWPPKWKTPVLMPASGGDVFLKADDERLTARDILENGRPKLFKKEVIEVAYNNMTRFDKQLEKIKGADGKLYPYPTSFCDQTDGYPDFEFNKKTNRSLRLHGDNSQSEYFRRNVNIDKGIEYKFEFLSDTIHNIRDVFVANNNRYVAKKIEIEVTQMGINRLQTGIFYLLNE